MLCRYKKPNKPSIFTTFSLSDKRNKKKILILYIRNTYHHNQQQHLVNRIRNLFLKKKTKNTHKTYLHSTCFALSKARQPKSFIVSYHLLLRTTSLLFGEENASISTEPYRRLPTPIQKILQTNRLLVGVGY